MSYMMGKTRRYDPFEHTTKKESKVRPSELSKLRKEDTAKHNWRKWYKDAFRGKDDCDES